MTLEYIFLLLVGIFIGLSLKGLFTYASLSIQLEQTRLVAQRALILIDLLEERLTLRITQLETDFYSDDTEGDYEAPALTPYGGVPGWKGEQDVVQ